MLAQQDTLQDRASEKGAYQLFFFRAKIHELFFAQRRPYHCVLAPKRALSASSPALLAAATRRLVV